MNNILLQDVDISFATTWYFIIQPPECWSIDLCWHPSNERFKGDIQDKHLVVTNPIPKWHHTCICNLYFALDPKSVNRLAAPDEGRARTGARVI
jgi:hypothetical protein